MPIPQPRKKCFDQEKSVSFNAPDLTLNHASQLLRGQSWKKEINFDEIYGQKHSRESIPDIIVSQLRYEMEKIPSEEISGLKFEELYSQLSQTVDENILLPGDLFEVILEKKDGSLGLRIYQENESNSSEQHIYIHSINPNSAADLDGRIKPGDELIKVNDVSLKNLSYREVLTELRDSSKVAHLVLKKGNMIDSKQINRDSKKASSKLVSKIDNEDLISQKMSAAVKRSEYAKVNGKKSTGKFGKELTLHCSTPNLTENFNEETKSSSFAIYPNKSTQCLTSPVSSNSHKALFNIYQKFHTNKGTVDNLPKVPTLPVKRKKLKKIEDIFDYSNSDNTFTVSITKSNRGLGFCIFGGTGVYGREVFSQLIRIRKFYPLQPAVECGKLQLGDVILSVNGTNMVGLTNTEALGVLRAISSNVVMEVFRPSKSLIPSYTIFEDGLQPLCDSSFNSTNSFLSPSGNSHDVETGEFEITLIKQSGSLGFSIFKKESSDYDEGIYVTALIKEPAISNGRIQPGDKILQVNGVSISSMSKAEAIEFIRKTPESVTLKLARDGLPLTPGYTEKDNQITKPLRWEAMKLLDAHVKNKSCDENSIAKRKVHRKLTGSSNTFNSSTESLSSASSSSSEQEHSVEESIKCDAADGLGIERSSLQNESAKLLDVSNLFDIKQLLTCLDEESLHRQASLSTPNGYSKRYGEKYSIDNFLKKACKNFIKWKGSPLSHKTKNLYSDVIRKAHFSTSPHSNEQSKAGDSSSDDEKPVLFSCATSPANDCVNTFDVVLDRGWHGRLGFSLHDPTYSDNVAESGRCILPKAAEVKIVHPGSLADKDGRIKDGDRIVEVNRKCLLDIPANEVIDILNKTRGVMRMVFCRLEKRL